MITKVFPINPAIKSVSFENDIMTIEYYRYKRRYEATKELFYKLYYSADPLKFYANNIRKKLKLIW